ncbi:MAG: hypothetical protein FJ045_06130 [Crenarchaeota archaeon]|nr:hypothetical protein [Thermoproteota archaeon]
MTSPLKTSNLSEIEYQVGDRRYVVTCLANLLLNGGFETGIDPTLVPLGWYAGWSSWHEQVDIQVLPDLNQGGHRFQMQAFPKGMHIRALMTSGKAELYLAGAAVSAVEMAGPCCVQIAWIDPNWRTLPWLGPGGTPVVTPRGCVLSNTQTFQFLFSEPGDANWLALDLTATGAVSGRCEFDRVFVFPLTH